MCDKCKFKISQYVYFVKSVCDEMELQNVTILCIFCEVSVRWRNVVTDTSFSIKNGGCQGNSVTILVCVAHSRTVASYIAGLACV